MRFLPILLCAGTLFWQAPATMASSMAAGASITPKTTCGDFLARTGKKPAHLVYAGCAYLPDEQGKPLRATYRVGGRYAVATEAYLVRSAKLDKLRRSCCQWDSRPRQFIVRGQEYTIRMISDETAISSRNAWPRIARFEVTVETFTEEI